VMVRPVRAPDTRQAAMDSITRRSGSPLGGFRCANNLAHPASEVEAGCASRTDIVRKTSGEAALSFRCRGFGAAPKVIKFLEKLGTSPTLVSALLLPEAVCAVSSVGERLRRARGRCGFWRFRTSAISAWRAHDPYQRDRDLVAVVPDQVRRALVEKADSFIRLRVGSPAASSAVLLPAPVGISSDAARRAGFGRVQR